MHDLKRLYVAIGAAVIAAAFSPVAGMARGSSPLPTARSYSGTWPVTVSNSQHSDGTGCLTFTGNGRSGQASLVFRSQKYIYGSFVVSDGILIVTITEPLYGQNGALMFTAHAKHGHIGTGVFENVEGGSNFDHGLLAFGSRGGC